MYMMNFARLPVLSSIFCRRSSVPENSIFIRAECNRLPSSIAIHYHCCVRTLFLDLGSNKGTLACVNDQLIVHLVTIDHRIDDASLMGLIERTVKDAGWSYQDLNRIACVVGPGGFTSLRVGVATANALADALEIPMCGVHLSDVYAARMTNDAMANDQFVWFHSTKKNELFIRGPGIPEPQHITLDQLPAHLRKGGEWMGELIPDQKSIVENAGMKEATLRPLQEILPAFLATQDYKRQILQPWYGRGW